MKNRTKKWIAAGVGLVVLSCAGYFAIARYYRDEFSLNTWINGIYCTGRDVEDVNAELIRRTPPPPDLEIIGYAGVGENAPLCSWTLSVKDLGYTVDYSQNLRRYLEEQNPYLWVDNVTFHREHEISPAIAIDETLLKKWWKVQETIAGAKEDYCIEYSGSRGYYLYDGMNNRLDAERAYRYVLDAIYAGESSIDLTELECYYDSGLSAKPRRTADLWSRLELFQNNGPVYDFGDGEWQAEPAAMVELLQKETKYPYLPLLDEKGRLKISDEAAESFVIRIAQEHDTFGKTWKFESTRGETVDVPGVTYGTEMDQEAEVSWLKSYLGTLVLQNSPKRPAAHVPEYTKEAYCRSCKSVGDTYVEVDMGVQKLYYYEKGELRIETDIVTGNARRKMNTPEGVNFVYAKQKHRVLRGQGYASPVDFWMPVKGAIGIHDAKWRSEFGGEIYKTNGSHGCVNLPRDVMAELYDLVEIGTPVVMFYGSEP